MAASKKSVPVELAPGVTVDSEILETILMPGGAGVWTVRLRVDPSERVPCYVGYSEQYSEPVPTTSITNRGTRALIELAVAKNAERHASKRMVAAHGKGWAVSSRLTEFYPALGEIPSDWPTLDEDEIERVGKVAASTIKPRRGRPRVSDEKKLEILTTYDAMRESRDERLDKLEKLFKLKRSTLEHHLTDARRIRRMSE